MVKKFYEAPEMEMIRLTVEAGFAQSGGDDYAGGTGDGGGSESGGQWGDN